MTTEYTEYAFPLMPCYGDDGCGIHQGSSGMTLLDWFATHAPITYEMAVKAYDALQHKRAAPLEYPLYYYQVLALWVKMKYDYAEQVMKRRKEIGL